MASPEPGGLVRRAFVALGRRYVRRLLRAGLGGVRVSGLEHARRTLAAGPVLFAANHVSWWDGLLVVVLNEALDADGRVLVDAERLAQHRFFEAFGAIPLDRTDGLRARAGLRRLAAHLSGPGRAGWVFPQGAHRADHLRPLGLARGWEHTLRRAQATILPVAVAYRFGEGPRPTAWVHFGEGTSAADLEPALVAGLSTIDRAAPEGVGFPSLVPDRGEWSAPTRALSSLWTWFFGRGEMEWRR